VSDEKPVPLWLTIANPIIFICSLGVIAHQTYQSRNTRQYERDTAQYDGWMYAEWNDFADVGQCEDTDGGWAALGIETSIAFLDGCRVENRSR